MAITELHPEYALPVRYGSMLELGAAFQAPILETGGNFASTFDFGVFVVVIAHAHLEFLEACDGLIQFTR